MFRVRSLVMSTKAVGVKESILDITVRETWFDEDRDNDIFPSCIGLVDPHTVLAANTAELHLCKHLMQREMPLAPSLF